MKAEDEHHAALQDAARVVRDHRSGIVLSGHIKDGKVELDKATLDEIAQKFGRANTSFVAVNAPFDPNSNSV
jgi:transcriptional regulator of acetoin/glycerol metabolism